ADVDHAVLDLLRGDDGAREEVTLVVVVLGDAVGDALQLADGETLQALQALEHQLLDESLVLLLLFFGRSGLHRALHELDDLVLFIGREAFRSLLLEVLLGEALLLGDLLQRGEHLVHLSLDLLGIDAGLAVADHAGDHEALDEHALALFRADCTFVYRRHREVEVVLGDRDGGRRHHRLRATGLRGRRQRRRQGRRQRRRRGLRGRHGAQYGSGEPCRNESNTPARDVAQSHHEPFFFCTVVPYEDRDRGRAQNPEKCRAVMSLKGPTSRRTI